MSEIITCYVLRHSITGLFLGTPDDTYLTEIEAKANAPMGYEPWPVKRTNRNPTVDELRLRLNKHHQAERDAHLAISALLRDADAWKRMAQEHGGAIRMIRETIETLFGPVADLESEEAVLLRGPEPRHDAEAIIAALQRINVKIENDAIIRDEYTKAMGAANELGYGMMTLEDIIKDMGANLVAHRL